MPTAVAEFGVPEPTGNDACSSVVFLFARAVIIRRLEQESLDLFPRQGRQNREPGHRRLLPFDPKLLSGKVHIDPFDELIEGSGGFPVTKEAANERGEKLAGGR